MRATRAASSSPSRPNKLFKMEESIDLPSAITDKAELPAYRPDAKERRYDRQLRLWASSGQRSLEQASVLLVGCDATGSQAIKNLVLPGIASFTICSDHVTTPKDVATNFFLQASSVGKPIASELVKHLCELNPSVQGYATKENVHTLLEKDPDYLQSFSLVIVSNADPPAERRIADALWSASSEVEGKDIPLLAIRNSGFVGRLEVQFREHCVNDTHPDTTHTLRIDQPFQALADYARSLDLDKMDSTEHSHIPWAVLLVRASLDWEAGHDGVAPRDQDGPDGVNEQYAFKQRLNSMRHKADEENFDEAVAQAYQVWAKSSISSELQALLDDVAKHGISKESKNVRILLSALRRYLEDHALPPISPTLPDMHSSTESYINLQNLYRTQHRQDLAAFQTRLTATLADIGLPADTIDQSEVEAFVKNTNGVAVVKGSPLSARRDISGELKARCDDGFGLDDWPTTFGLPLHLGLVAADVFYDRESRWPGRGDPAMFENDLEQIRSILVAMLQAGGRESSDIPEDVMSCLHEVVRGGFSTLPTTAALLGGLAAQEAIKLVTSQYAPLDNTCVVDLVHSTTARFTF